MKGYLMRWSYETALSQYVIPTRVKPTHTIREVL